MYDAKRKLTIQFIKVSKRVYRNKFNQEENCKTIHESTKYQEIRNEGTNELEKSTELLTLVLTIVHSSTQKPTQSDLWMT